MVAVFHTDSGVLYNCQATVSYVASNGSDVQIIKELGIVDINVNKQGTGFTLTDYLSETPFMLDFSNTNPLPAVQIEAYGYTKP